MRLGFSDYLIVGIWTFAVGFLDMRKTRYRRYPKNP